MKEEICECGHLKSEHRFEDFHPEIEGIKRDGSCAICEISEDGEDIIWECPCKKFVKSKDKGCGKQILDSTLKCGDGKKDNALILCSECRKNNKDFAKSVNSVQEGKA